MIELMVVLAVTLVLLAVAAPGVRDMILMQRLRAVHQQLLADLQFARSTAVAQGQARRVGITSWQNVFLVVRGGNGGGGCYIVFTDTQNRSNACDCSQPAGSRCTDPANSQELRTVQLGSSDGVLLAVPTGSTGVFEFGPVTGGPEAVVSQMFGTVSYANAAVQVSAGDARAWRTRISPAGRPSTCVPAGSVLEGTPC